MLSCSLVLCAVFAPLNSSGTHSEPPATDCETLSACIDRIGELGRLPNPYGGLTPEQQALIRSVLSFGDAAVPPLVQLLSDPDEVVADLAAATLRDAPRIAPRYLPAIRAGLDHGLGWLAPALGRMHDSEAAREPERFIAAIVGALDDGDARVQVFRLPDQFQVGAVDDVGLLAPDQLRVVDGAGETKGAAGRPMR